MLTKHKINRIFSRKTKERLEVYFLILQILSVILLILSQF